MSDTAIQPAAPVAPAAPATPVAPVTPVVVATPPAAPKVSASDFDRSMSGKTPQTPAPSGTPAPEPTIPPVAAVSGAGDEPPPPPPSGEPAAEPATPQATPVPEGHVAIQIPEALQRNFGRERIVPKADEELFRFALNNHIKTSEYDTISRKAGRADVLENEVNQLREQLMRLESKSVATEKWRSGEQYQAALQVERSLREQESLGELPAGTADKYMAGIENDLRELEDQTYKETRQTAEEKRVVEAATAFRQDMHGLASTSYPHIASVPGFTDAVEMALDAYGLALDRREKVTGKPQGINQAEFIENHLRAAFMATPSIRAAFQQLRAQRQAQTPPVPPAPVVAVPPVPVAPTPAPNPMGNLTPGQVGRDSGIERPRVNASDFDRLMSRR